MTDAEHVALFYRVLLGRDPDESGLAYHVALIAQSGGDLRPAVQSIVSSPEYLARHSPSAALPLAPLLRRRLTIVDVGAQNLTTEDHVYTPLLQAGIPCDCIGFEPLAARRAERAHTDGTAIRLLPHVIGDGSTQTFYVNNEDNTSSLLPLNLAFNAPFAHLRDLRTVRTETVHTTRLDDVLQEVPRIDFLKLDIQGFELFALRGAEGLLPRTNVVHCEVEFAPIYKAQPLFADVESFLRARGFAFIDFTTLMRYRYASVPDPNEMPERLCWADAVFFRTLASDAAGDDAIAQAVIASHVYGKNGLAKQLLIDAGEGELLI